MDARGLFSGSRNRQLVALTKRAARFTITFYC
jgi:hypothetical protein